VRRPPPQPCSSPSSRTLRATGTSPFDVSVSVPSPSLSWTLSYAVPTPAKEPESRSVALLNARSRRRSNCSIMSRETLPLMASPSVVGPFLSMRGWKNPAGHVSPRSRRLVCCLHFVSGRE
jgi:hypothetical protein